MTEEKRPNDPWKQFKASWQQIDLSEDSDVGIKTEKRKAFVSGVYIDVDENQRPFNECFEFDGLLTEYKLNEFKRRIRWELSVKEVVITFIVMLEG